MRITTIIGFYLGLAGLMAGAFYIGFHLTFRKVLGRTL